MKTMCRRRTRGRGIFARAHRLLKNPPSMIRVYFHHLPETICFLLAQAKTSIRAAVCWFSHTDIFETLTARLHAGVKVELLMEYDSQNIRDGGLDFQSFIRNGGHLYAYREPGLMHHKFALIDDLLLLTGSFNWTRNSNAENLLSTEDAGAVADFQQEFEQQRVAALRIFKVRKEDVKLFSAFPLFENTRFHLPDLRKKVSSGAGVWRARLDKLGVDKAWAFKENRLPFDRRRLLSPFWASWRIWDEQLFDEALEGLSPACAPARLRELRLWGRRIKTGDIVLATERKNELLAIGIVQSAPQRQESGVFSSYRDVQWLKVLPMDAPHLLTGVSAGQPVARFRGSALRLLQEVFGP